MREFEVLEMIYDDYKTFLIVSKKFNATCRVSIFYNEPDEAIITDLYVKDDVRRNNIGTRLLKFSILLSHQQQCKYIELKSKEDNWIRDWYRKIGFELISADGWMRKNINNERIF